MTTWFVTSFGGDMLHVSGQPLIKTFVERQAANQESDRLFVFVEDGIENEVVLNGSGSERVEVVSLDRDPWLHEVLKKHKDTIPKHLGGTVDPCSCPLAGGHRRRHAKHKKGCRYKWMDRNWARWFRKVVAQQRVVERCETTTAPPDFVVWVDADSRFKQPVGQDVIEETIGDHDFCLFKGRRREAPETGLIVFRVPSAFVFIRSVWEHYDSGEFRERSRWDDGYVVGWLAENRLPEGLSWVDPVGGAVRDNHVIPTTAIGRLIHHDKGRHGRKKGIML